ncbi:MAG: HEAT repeat domain-containing protein, partial [Armatimonadetes bacterium]|nr:HEAT repeat domain-containing protein [Armatimonadota bacterium]
LQYAAIEALGERGDRSAVPALESAAGETNERVRCAAVEALGRLGDAAGLDAIASAWEKGPGKVKQASVTACLEIANGLLAKGDKTKANAVFQQVEGRAATESDRITAIDGIGRSGLADSLGRLEPLMKDKGAVREAAIKASASIADSLATSGKKEEAVKVYLKCLDLSSGALSDALAGRLKELGVAFSSPRGFITYWWVAGPFLGEGRAAWTESYFPEKEIDLKKEYVAGQTKIKWQGGSTDSEGVLDLAGLLTPNENAAAYCFVELNVEKEQDVYLKAGSDDGIRLWLNGALIHDKLVDRGLTVDEDRVEAHLRAGANRLLLKVTNGGGGYNVCLRITERTNRPLKFKIKTEAD